MNDEGANQQLFGCRNCGGMDFCLNYDIGDSTCVECGCVDDARLAIHCHSYKATFGALGEKLFDAPMAESIRSGAYYENILDAQAESRATLSNSAPYRRQTYWAERISQWRMLEPDIEHCDLQRIERKWEDFTCKYSMDPAAVPKFPGKWIRRDSGARVFTYTLTKEDCRAILWSIDEDIAKCPLTQGKPFYVKKYLVSACFLFCLFAHSCAIAFFTTTASLQLYATQAGT